MEPDEIKRLREHLKWSQERLAREAGVSFCTVNRWERGRTAPSPMAVEALNRLKARSMADKRGAVRLSLRCPITVEGLARSGRRAGIGKTAAFKSVTENVSVGGLMFRCLNGLIRRGDRLSISFSFRDGNGAKALSEVVWTDGGKDGLSVGVRYESVGQGDMARLANAMLLG